MSELSVITTSVIPTTHATIAVNSAARASRS